MKECHSVIDEPRLFIGDFNQVLQVTEKYSSSQSVEGAAAFQETLDQTGLLGVKSYGVWFTWLNITKGEDLVMERLDKAFCNEKWLSQYPWSHIFCLPIAAFDYSPLLFDMTMLEVMLITSLCGLKNDK